MRAQHQHATFPRGGSADVHERHRPEETILTSVLRDVLECTRCKGRMEIVAALTSKQAVAGVLGHLGLSAEVPQFHPARPPPQVELPFADETPDFVADAPAPDDFGA